MAVALALVLAPARAMAGLASLQLGAELVASALPAFGDLLDGVAHGLEPVQLARARAPGGGTGALGRSVAGAQALDVLVEVAAKAA